MIPESIQRFLDSGLSLPWRSMTFFNFLLEATLAGSILIIVTLILRRVFRKKIGSRLIYMAWLLVAIRLLVPLALPNPLMDEFRPTNSTDSEARPVADQFRIRFPEAVGQLVYMINPPDDKNSIHPYENPISRLILTLASYTRWGVLGKICLLLYALGGVTIAGVFTLRHIRFRKKLMQESVGSLEGEHLALYESLCKDMGVKPLPVILADPLPSPCLVGVMKPIIALPLVLPPESLSEALRHELCHYKAKDPWWALLRCVCCAVHWFNPLVWMAQPFVSMDCEFACDERVAAALSDEERLHYGNTLILTAKQSYRPKAGILATGLTMTGRRLKKRVGAIVNMQTIKKTAAALTAVVLVALTFSAFFTAESTTQRNTLFSAFPFLRRDVYPTPDVAFSEPVAAMPLLNAAEAESAAKRYLATLFPNEKAAIETQYIYAVNKLSKSRWHISVYPPEDGETPLYTMELTSAGRLGVMYPDDGPANAEVRYNAALQLPGNLKKTLLDYSTLLGAAVLQSSRPYEAIIREDMESEKARFLTFGTGDADITVQIAPTFRLTGIRSNAADSFEGPQIP
jgi:Antirepressor regulating drug resistance, predicted signal transduction N-terminal membrane component